MKMTYPNSREPQIKHVHHDTSLSAFATGLFIGTVATLILATEEGRAAGKKLLNAVKETSKDLAPELEKLPGQIARTINIIETEANAFSPLDRLHRTANPTAPTFHRDGQSLR